MELVIKFTEHSKDVDNYGKLHANLKTPYTQFSTLMIDSLTSMACFEVLNKDDYITLVETKNGTSTAIAIHMDDNYSSLNSETMCTMLNEKFNTVESTIRVEVDNTNRLIFKNEYPIQIVAASYRMKEVLGIFDQPLPIESVANDENGYLIHCLSVGNYLSTSILYLISSIGDKVFVNGETGRTNRRILMRINNSYSANFPLIANNGDFSIYGLSNDFSDITFELVDANFNPIKLLSPMYLTGTLSGDIKTESINLSPYVPALLDKNNNDES